MLLVDVIARHAIPFLLGAVLVMLALAAVFWRVLRRYAPNWRAIAAHAWSAFRDTALAKPIGRLPLIGPLLTGSLSVARFLGVYALAAFLLAAGATALFFELADEIGVGESLADFDIALSAALREHLSRETLHVFSLVTTLGDPEFLIILGAIVAAILLSLRRWTLAAVWIVATVSGGLMNRLLKAIFERTRPVHDHGLLAETGWSFPSGHAAGSMLVYGLLGYVIMRHSPDVWRIPIAFVAAALIVFVGLSRVLLQVHYLSDVLAGFASAAAWLALCVAGLETVRWKGRAEADQPLRD